jgi:hypothetical protein
LGINSRLLTAAALNEYVLVGVRGGRGGGEAWLGESPGKALEGDIAVAGCVVRAQDAGFHGGEAVQALCQRALRRTLRLPAGFLGPVDLWALRRLASLESIQEEDRTQDGVNRQGEEKANFTEQS